MSSANYFTRLENGKTILDVDRDGVLEAKQINVQETIVVKNLIVQDNIKSTSVTINNQNFTTDSNNNISSGIDGISSTLDDRIDFSKNVKLDPDKSITADSATLKNLILNNKDVSLEISKIIENKNNIENNTTKINSNTLEIIKNDNDISNNSNKITQNLNKVLSNETNVNSNTTKIQSNTTKINKNISDIQTNNSKILNNETNITSNLNAINVIDNDSKMNKNSIISNATEITNNKNLIDTNTINIQNIGTKIDNFTINPTNINITNKDFLINDLPSGSTTGNTNIELKTNGDIISKKVQTDNLINNNNLTTKSINVETISQKQSDGTYKTFNLNDLSTNSSNNTTNSSNADNLISSTDNTKPIFINDDVNVNKNLIMGSSIVDTSNSSYYINNNTYTFDGSNFFELKDVIIRNHLIGPRSYSFDFKMNTTTKGVYTLATIGHYDNVIEGERNEIILNTNHNNGTTGQIIFISKGGGHTERTDARLLTILDGNYHNITITIMSASDYSIVTFYLDGVMFSVPLQFSSADLIKTETSGLLLGVHERNTEFLVGEIKKIELFDYSLTSTEIQTMYNKTPIINNDVKYLRNLIFTKNNPSIDLTSNDEILQINNGNPSQIILSGVENTKIKAKEIEGTTGKFTNLELNGNVFNPSSFKANIDGITSDSINGITFSEKSKFEKKLTTLSDFNLSNKITNDVNGLIINDRAHFSSDIYCQNLMINSSLDKKKVYLYNALDGNFGLTVDGGFPKFEFVDTDVKISCKNLDLSSTKTITGNLDVQTKTTFRNILTISSSDRLGSQLKLKPTDYNDRAIVSFYKNDDTLMYSIGTREDKKHLNFSTNIDPTMDETPTMCLTDNGYVGIGTNNPTANLEVIGNAIISGEIVVKNALDDGVFWTGSNYIFRIGTPGNSSYNDVMMLNNNRITINVNDVFVNGNLTLPRELNFGNDINQTQYKLVNDAGNFKITSDNNPLIEFQENNNNTLRLGCDNLVVTGLTKIESEMYIKNGFNDSVMWYNENGKFIIRNGTPGNVSYKDVMMLNNNSMTVNVNEMVVNGNLRLPNGKTMIGNEEGSGRLNIQDLTGNFIDFKVGNVSAGEIKYDVSTSGLTIESSNVLFNSNVSLPSTKDIVIGGVAVRSSISTIKNKLEILSDVPTLYKDTSGNNLISRNFISIPSTLNTSDVTISFKYKRIGDVYERPEDSELSSLFRLGNDVPSVDCFLKNDNTITINNYITFPVSNNNLNVEHHIVFTINNNTINVYYDGEHILINNTINSFPENLNHLMIGNVRSTLPGGATNLEFVGEITNFRIYNNELTTNQIKELINEDFRNLRMDNLDVINLGSGSIKKSREKSGIEFNTIEPYHSMFFNSEITINNVYNDCVLWSKNSFIFRLGETGNAGYNQILQVGIDETIFNNNLKIKDKRISCDATRDLIYFETNEIVFGNPTNNNKWSFKSGTNGIEVFQNNNFIGNVAIDGGGGGGSSGNWYDPYNPINTGGALFSDDRLKYNETDVKDALTTINELKIQNYKMTSKLMTDEEEKLKEQMEDKNRLKTGVIAQDLLKIPSLKHCVVEPENPETEAYKVDYFSLFCKSIKAIQELNKRVEDLENLLNKFTT